MKLSLAKIVIIAAAMVVTAVSSTAQKTSKASSVATNPNHAPSRDKKHGEAKAAKKDPNKVDVKGCKTINVESDDSITFTATDKDYFLIVFDPTLVFTSDNNCNVSVNKIGPGSPLICKVNTNGISPGKHHVSKYMVLPSGGESQCKPGIAGKAKGHILSSPNDITVP